MLQVEIADNPLKQAHGLMFRKSMPERSGMIFIFRKADKLKFWGVNTFIPLDIAFVDQHHRITEIASIKPMSDKTVVSSAPCHIAIEANIGFFKQHGIAVGDRINFERVSDKTGVVDFRRKKEAQFVGTREQGSQGVETALKVEQDTPAPPVEQQQQPDGTSLPVIDVANLSSILEDSYDEGQDENQIAPQEPQENQEEMLPENVPEISPQGLDQEKEQEPFEIPDEEYPNFSTPGQALQWAEQNHEAVRIWYTTKGGRDIEREVEPHGSFVAESTHNPIAVTFDETVGDIRAFIIPRILYYSFVGRQFQPKFVVRG